MLFVLDWDANDEGEMSIKVGDIITVIDRDESGWWTGRIEQTV